MRTFSLAALVLFNILFISSSFAANKLVGVWAEPNNTNPKILWYLFPDGKVKVTSNNDFDNSELRWILKGDTLTILSNKRSHKWEGLLSDKKINAKLTFDMDGEKVQKDWKAYKISDNPQKIINFYAVCSNSKKTWQVVNVGKFKKCNSTVPWENTTTYSFKEAKDLCLALIKKRKKERGSLEKCI